MKPTLIVLSVLFANATCLADESVNIGSRRELWVDDALVDRLADDRPLPQYALPGDSQCKPRTAESSCSDTSAAMTPTARSISRSSWTAFGW